MQIAQFRLAFGAEAAFAGPAVEASAQGDAPRQARGRRYESLAVVSCDCRASTRVGLSTRNNDVRFSIDWIGDGPNASAEERATLCDLQIVVNDKRAKCGIIGVIGGQSSETTRGRIRLICRAIETFLQDWNV